MKVRVNEVAWRAIFTCPCAAAPAAHTPVLMRQVLECWEGRQLRVYVDGRPFHTLDSCAALTRAFSSRISQRCSS